MSAKQVLVAGAGLAIGGVAGYFVHDLLKGSLPPVFARAAERLVLRDTQVNLNLEGPQFYGGGSEPNGYTYYMVGYGLPGGHLLDDVIITLARRTIGATSTIANCVKLADDAISVSLDGTLVVTLPNHGGATEKTLYNAFAWFNIPDA